ncbi:MAG: translocation/assembly module TamB domain-containing protein, partial [Planctomycetota bacterium]
KPAEKVIEIDFVRTGAGFGQIEIKNATMPMDKESGKPTTLDASVKLDLEKLTAYAVLAGALEKQVKLAGQAESKLFVRSQKNNYYIKTDSTKIKNLKITAPDKEPFEQGEITLNFDAEFNPAEKTINIKQLQLISPQIKIKKGQLRQVSKNGQTKLDGLFELEYDWSAVSAAAAAFMPEELKLEGKRTDTIRFSSRYPAEKPDKLLANLDSSAKIGFEKADYMGLHFGLTEVDIQIRKGLLTVAPFTSNVNKGQLSFAANADFKQTPRLLKTPNPIQIAKDIHINDETTKRLLKYLNPVFAGAVNVSGVANFDCEKLTLPLGGGKPEDIEMIGTVSISQLRLEASDLLGQILSAVDSSRASQDITIQPTRFILQKGRLEYDDMQMDIGNNPVNFKGVIGLDKSLDMTVTLPYKIGSREENGDNRVQLPLEGTVDKPKLNLGKLIEQQLQQQLKEKVPELQLLEELFKK